MARHKQYEMEENTFAENDNIDIELKTLQNERVEKPVKQKYRIILVAKNYIVIDKNGFNEFLPGAFNLKANDFIIL